MYGMGNVIFAECNILLGATFRCSEEIVAAYLLNWI